MSTLKRRVKEAYRRPYHRLWWAPRLRSVATGTFLRRDAVDTTHLLAFREGWEAIGPVQRDEAFALFGLLRTLRPRTVVEFGFFDGRSAFNMLRALDADARLFSYDVDDLAASTAAEVFADEPRLTFLHKSQAEFDPGDVLGRPVDFVFLDGAHDLALNQETLRRLMPALAPPAIIAVHDTGTVHRSLRPEEGFAAARDPQSPQWLSTDEFEHTPHERATVNWMRDEHPEFAQIHLHTHQVPRWGLTLLQRTQRLPSSLG